VSDKRGKTKEVFYAEDEATKIDEANDFERRKQEVNDKLKAEANKDGIMWRTLMLNKPMYFLPLGLFMACVQGSAQPVFAVQFSRMMNYMTIPFEAIPLVYWEDIEPGQSG
jgi:hypothetical protein